MGNQQRGLVTAVPGYRSISDKGGLVADPHPVQGFVDAAVIAGDGKGATAPVALLVAEQFGFADAFLILTGSVERQVQAISDAVEERVNAAGLRTIRREGRESGRWILLDFGDLIVHVFHEEDREYYQLERLWGDSLRLDLQAALERARFANTAPDGVE